MERILKGECRYYLMGVAILAIVAFHFCFYSNLLSSKFFGFFFSHGYVGVDVFLFLSSYGLCFSYEKNGIKRYFFNRIKRLYPMYLLFIVVAVFLFHSGYDDSAIKLAFFQCTGIASFRSVDFEWFIPALIVLYCIFPALFHALKWLYQYNKYLLLIAVFISITLVPAFSLIVFPLYALRFPIILMGIIAYLAMINDDNSFLLVVFLTCSLFTVICKVDNALVLSLLIPSTLWFLDETNVRLPFMRTIGFVGHHSFEIYLAQNLALNHYFLNSDTPFIIKSLIALTIIIVVSFVLSYFQKGFYALFSKPEKECNYI